MPIGLKYSIFTYLFKWYFLRYFFGENHGILNHFLRDIVQGPHEQNILVSLTKKRGQIIGKIQFESLVN